MNFTILLCVSAPRLHLMTSADPLLHSAWHSARWWRSMGDRPAMPYCIREYRPPILTALTAGYEHWFTRSGGSAVSYGSINRFDPTDSFLTSSSPFDTNPFCHFLPIAKCYLFLFLLLTLHHVCQDDPVHPSPGPCRDRSPSEARW